MDLSATVPVEAADGTTIDAPIEALKLWGFTTELLDEEDELDRIAAIMVPTGSRLQRIVDFSTSYVRQGVAWHACLLKKVDWMEVEMVPEWCRALLRDLPTNDLFDLIEDAAAVRFRECENVCLMHVAWRIKEMDEETAMNTFALDSQWSAQALSDAIAPGARGEQFARFLHDADT
ncbi:hypothetical protein FNF29_05049 [Cafeteria roenbergensis]|uniref:Uncharacterized protein n=1 Tax=Cafeteria roenbergensis TaxID=33653 RepID=A0A5A8CCL1_CAFRO|nr:hypothetical protein FNF29_05049 [Cafeteria roenbergensis]KAA0167176.1 hypothetical protein FNF31_01062 [Cafeteria roenbergensis]|eukprot:KAA0150712.1 hypothetical protein FNF29_05049 [Cafeteria roenbergensis]